MSLKTRGEAELKARWPIVVWTVLLVGEVCAVQPNEIDMNKLDS